MDYSSTPPREASPSIGQAINASIGWTKWALFPFDFAHWMVLSFTAWLMLVMRNGLSNSSFNYRTGSGGGKSQEEDIRKAVEFIQTYMTPLVAAAVTLFLIMAVVMLVVRWLNARGTFMFLDGIVTRTPSIPGSWAEYAREGNSLFKAYAAAWVGGAALGLIAFVPPILYMWKLLVAGTLFADAWWPALLVAIPFLVITTIAGISIALVMLFIEDFLVPLMYGRRLLLGEAWALFRPLLSANKGKFFVYTAARIGIAIVVNICMFIILIVTCVCTCCILWLPVLWVLPVLPLITFTRFLPILYLEQFGSEWAVLPRQW